ncbi:hypothetical protein, partial [Vibrio lentus]|uniref:hypothetical protein n=1 Tax=Vibrio lentus TaxID=136468 RepID=UPI001A7E18B1
TVVQFQYHELKLVSSRHQFVITLRGGYQLRFKVCRSSESSIHRLKVLRWLRSVFCRWMVSSG